MLDARLDKVMKHSPTDLGCWKRGQVHTLRCLTYTMYKCHMYYRCMCLCVLQLVMCSNQYIELQHSKHLSSKGQPCSRQIEETQVQTIACSQGCCLYCSAALSNNPAKEVGSKRQFWKENYVGSSVQHAASGLPCVPRYFSKTAPGFSTWGQGLAHLKNLHNSTRGSTWLASLECSTFV